MGRDLPRPARLAEDTPPEPSRVDALLAGDKAITHVAVVHCETTSGILNPLAEIAAVVAQRGRRLLVDSMSGFGALPVDSRRIRFDALAASANKCLEGVPGMAFVIAARQALIERAGNAPTLSFDLLDQCAAMETDGAVALHAADPSRRRAGRSAAMRMKRKAAPPARLARYRGNRTHARRRHARGSASRRCCPMRCRRRSSSTFHMPADPRFRFETFYDGLRGARLSSSIPAS